jgi:hypothetical protein
MVFVGFGMLYTFLKHQSFGSVAINLFLAVLSVPLGMLSISFFRALLEGTISEGFADYSVAT